jgi:hypothetical protein
MRRPYCFVLLLAVAACSAGHDTPGNGTTAIGARAYRGPAIVTGTGDLAACPRKWDLEQYRNDMMNMRVDPSDPAYQVARAYDLRNRRCIELNEGERVDIEGGSHISEALLRPLGQSQSYWTTAHWTAYR